MRVSSPKVEIVPIDREPCGAEVCAAGPLNVFVHGYRSLTSPAQVDAMRQRVAALRLPGRSVLLNWEAGGWRQGFQNASATVAGLRAAYRVAKLRRVFAPWMLLVDAGVVGIAEVAEFKRRERRAEQLGAHLAPLLEETAGDAPINLIGHSLGARVIHRLLADGMTGEGGANQLTIHDVVLLGGAADLEADDWPDCLRRIDGRLFNAYSPRDRILWMTPDLRRRVGGAAMPPVVVNGIEKVVNHRCEKVSHVEYWTRLNTLLPKIWQPTPQ